jgi:hypothetical protein
MPLTVRLNARTERALDALARSRRQTRSDVVREALEQFTDSNSGDAARGRPYDAWLDVIGVVSTGARDRKETTGEQFAALVREKARARRSR